MGQIVTKNRKTINGDTVIGTIDVGSMANYGYYRSKEGFETEPFEFSNDRAGFDKYWDAIRGFRDSQKLREIIIGIESTGVYSGPAINYFKDKPVKMVQINPKHTKRAKEITDNSPNKTDRKDPRVIADIMEIGKYLEIVKHEGAIAELRTLTLARERAVGRRTGLNNQMHALVFEIFPEFVQMMNLNGKCATYILENMPTPTDIVAYGEERLLNKLREIGRSKLKEEKIKALYAAAQKSAGIREGRESIVMEINEILLERSIIAKHISAVEDKMCHYLKAVPASRYILSMKGIGEVTAAGIIGELGDFSNFSHSDGVLKFSGLNLCEASSGKHLGNKRISKIGRSLVRKHLYYAAISMVRKGGIMHDKYSGYIARGMTKMKALVAIMRKLLVIMFALVKKHVEFQKDYFVSIVQAA